MHLTRWTRGKLLAALPTKWSPVTAPATSCGGDQQRLRRRERELEEEGESEDAQKTRKLTLDALGLAVVKEEVEAGSNHSEERWPEAEKNRTAASIAASPRRFLGRGGRGRGGGALARLRSARR